jgi:multiple sugar transport system permease protein
MADLPSTRVARRPIRLLADYRSRRARQEVLGALLLLLPAIVILGVVIFYPLVQALQLSFQNANLLSLGMAQNVGLSNFQQLVSDNTFWTAVLNTIVFVGVSVAGGLLLGGALALLLNERIPLRSLFRSLALVPWVAPGVVVALLALYMFNSQVGVVDYALTKIGVSHQFIDWYGSPHNALWAEIIPNIWNQTPFYMLMILAGLQAVPTEQYEAAHIDGASVINRFRYVTLPNIRGVLMIVTSLMVIWNVNNFDLIWATTQGGPLNATMTLSVYVYRTAFTALNIGYAAAIGLVWLVFLLLFSFFYIRALERGEWT